MLSIGASLRSLWSAMGIYLLKQTAEKYSPFFYCWSAVVLVSLCVGTIRQSQLDISREKKEFKIISNLDINQILEFDGNGNGVSCSEFTLGMIALIEQDESLNRRISNVMNLFKAYDTDNSGKIDAADLRKITQTKKNQVVAKKKKLPFLLTRLFFRFDLKSLTQ